MVSECCPDHMVKFNQQLQISTHSRPKNAGNDGAQATAVFAAIVSF